jgi:hypothetical protein
MSSRHVRLLCDERQRRRRWTCRTHVSKVVAGDELEIAPLSNLPVIKDLATDMREFFDKWARAKGQFKGSKTRHDDFARVEPASKGAACRRRRHRMHRLRHLLCLVRRRQLASGFSWARRAQSRVDAGQ